MGFYGEDLSLCDQLIEYHKNSDNKYQGHAGTPENIEIDKTVKDSTDVNLDDFMLQIKYVDHFMQPMLEKYIQKYSYVNANDPWRIVEGINIQHYAPGQGFHKFHCERGTYESPICNRHLVYMTYLNDIEEGGETVFHYQDIKVKPEKGLTLFWPTDWPFTHKGLTSKFEKYIVTGWYSYVPKMFLEK